mmetsp:Transcript_73373/g.116936  ORF Transcript_73373/g.116936 Transcript_73373/m.116936 type:complete len:691 (+) Transcript_73373:29-2101(+)
MTSSYLGPRNKPQRLKTITFGLNLVIDKTLGASDKIILPEMVINEIMREFTNPPNPIIFEIHSVLDYNRKNPAAPQLHCGVLEFTADEKTARIPYWMTYCLKQSNGERVKAGDRMKFKLVRGLEPAKFAKFRPLDKRFARDIQTPRASLEHALRRFTALTAGQRIPIIHDGKVYPLQVEEVRPSPAAHLIDTNLQVEFTAHDESKAFDEEQDVKGLINGHKTQTNGDEEEAKANNDDDEHVEVEPIALYSTISNTAKEKKARYYKVKVGNPNFGMRFILKIVSGDANIYVHYEFDKPSITQHHWFDESDSKQKVLNISNQDPKFSNWFYIGVHSFQSHCEYQLIVDQDMSALTQQQTTASESSGSMLGSADNEKEQEIPANMQKCENCGKLIAKQSFMMHSMRCSNVNWKCDICGKVIAKSMKAKHIHCAHWNEYRCALVFESESAMQRHVQLRHTEIECSLCGCKLFPNQIQSHQQHECTFRKIGCQFCGMKIKYLELQTHEQYCGSLTIECELCGETVTRKWLQNHLASEHNINPTLQTTLIDTIIHSNLGLDQSMDWERKQQDDLNALGSVEDMERIKSLDEDDELDENGQAGKVLNELEDLDPVVKSIKRQLSKASSVGDVNNLGSMQRTVTDPNAHDKIVEDEEDDDGDVHEFPCPFCQKHPPKSQEFGEHLANCNEKQMNEDSD